MQNYTNHRRFHPLYHYTALPLSLLSFIILTLLLIKEVSWTNLLIALLTISNFIVLALVRGYAIKNQDRIIRLEMRQRYFELSGKSFSENEKQLKLAQIIALRFAQDEELLLLVEETIKQNMSADQIKQTIQHWKADNNRV